MRESEPRVQARGFVLRGVVGIATPTGWSLWAWGRVYPSSMRRARRSRGRRVGKWTGVVLTALVTGVWLGSVWCSVGYKVGAGRGPWFGIDSGAAMEIWSVQGSGWPEPAGVSIQVHRKGALPTPTIQWWPRYDPAASPAHGLVSIPLWPIAILLGVTSVALWCRDARATDPGRCPRCGYDLAGLATTPCPECGDATPPA